MSTSAPKIRPEPQNVEMAHVTLTMPTWGIVVHHEANTSGGQLVCRYDLSNWDLLPLTYRPNLRFLSTAITRI